MSCLMFDEFERMTSKQMLLFTCGINVTIWGVAALTRRSTIVGEHDILEVSESKVVYSEAEGILAIQTDEDFDASHCCEVDRWAHQIIL